MTLHRCSDVNVGTLPFTQGSPASIAVNETGHDAGGARSPWVIVGSTIGAPTVPAMQGSLVGASPVGPTKMLVAPMSAAIWTASSRKTGFMLPGKAGLPGSTSP